MGAGQGVRVLIALISAAAVSFALTLIYLGMRAVMDVGGFCAEGGPYVIAVHCPKGIDWVIPVAIFGGLIAAAIYKAAAPAAAGNAVLLAWSALFLSLGWNFIDYGLGFTTPPGFSTGIEPGSLIPGILFVIMGAAPLFVWIPQLVRAAQGKPPPAVSRRMPTALHIDRSAARGWPVVTPTGPTGTTARDLAGSLERLAALHRQGELTDSEYETAKREALEGAAT